LCLKSCGLRKSKISQVVGNGRERVGKG
jgi:hypothetical protein